MKLSVHDHVPKTGDVKQLMQLLDDPSQPPFAYCEVMGPSMTPVDIERAHDDSMSHVLKPGVSPPGASMPFRSCLGHLATAPVIQQLIDAGVAVSYAHPERAWVYQGRRAFQGCIKRVVAGPGPFLEVAPPESARHILLPLTDRPILFGYAGCGNGMCAPHGVAKSARDTRASNWHSEPGGNVLVFVTHNSEKGSCGFYLKLRPEPPVANLERRLEIAERGKYAGVHDDTLLNWLRKKWRAGTPLDSLMEIANFICMGSNALPVTWCGNYLSDPLCIKGCGRPANIKKLKDGELGYRLPWGVQELDHFTFGDYDPPALLREWIDTTGFAFVALHDLDTLARDHPTVFEAYFGRTWKRAEARPAKVARHK